MAYVTARPRSKTKPRQESGIRRGDIYWADFGVTVGCEQSGLRPILILQNDVGNRFSPTTIGAALSASLDKTRLPVHVRVNQKQMHLESDVEPDDLAHESDVHLEQVRTIDKSRLKGKIGHLDDFITEKIDKALMISLGLSQ